MYYYCYYYYTCGGTFCVQYTLYYYILYRRSANRIRRRRRRKREKRSESDRAACFAWQTIVRGQWVGELAYLSICSVHCARMVLSALGPPAHCPLITLRSRRRNTRTYNIIFYENMYLRVRKR